MLRLENLIMCGRGVKTCLNNEVSQLVGN